MKKPSANIAVTVSLCHTHLSIKKSSNQLSLVSPHCKCRVFVNFLIKEVTFRSQTNRFNFKEQILFKKLLHFCSALQN